MMEKRRDLTGRQFGWLTVIRYGGWTKKTSTLWLCRCLCGNMELLQGSALVSGAQKSCGCRAAALARAVHSEAASMSLAILYGEAVNLGVQIDGDEAHWGRIQAARRRERPDDTGQMREGGGGEAEC
jgi:hypothetical protein